MMSPQDHMKYLRRYDIVAGEYYDALRHPTCKNLRDASLQILRHVLDGRFWPGLACEVGAGASLLAEVWLEIYGGAERLILTDASEAMLTYSRRFIPAGARLAVAQAEALPLPDRSVGLVASMLGDSYNRPAFWSEVSRVLEAGGCAIFTGPSYEWARKFRTTHQQESDDWAYFQLRERGVYVPSLILREDKQRILIERHGLLVREVVSVGIEMVAPPLSPKLTVLGPGRPAVTGYIIEKPQQA
jgi:ubiquinone/menaquinone biosynthesis C-methylase UbiE